MLRFSIVALTAIGCSSSDPTPISATDSGSDTQPIGSPIDTGMAPDGTSMPGAAPPPRPSVMVAGGATKWFVLRRLDLGINRRTDGLPDANAWKDYGFDLDARTTTKEDSKVSLNSCKRREGSPTNVLADGNAGRDNNFGQHVMSVIKSLKADAEDTVNASIIGGHTTLLLRLDNVGPTDNASVPGTLMAAGRFSTTMNPTFVATEKWPSVAGTTASFPNGYMAGGIWVSGDRATASALIPLPLTASPIMVPLDGALISFDVTTGKTGTIAGAANATKLIEALTPLMKSLGVGICPGNATYEQVVSTITQSADLVGGAPLLQDTTRTCDAISIGLGFTAVPVSASDTTVGPPAPAPDECAPSDAG